MKHLIKLMCIIALGVVIQSCKCGDKNDEEVSAARIIPGTPQPIETHSRGYLPGFNNEIGYVKREASRPTKPGDTILVIHQAENRYLRAPRHLDTAKKMHRMILDN